MTRHLIALASGGACPFADESRGFVDCKIIDAEDHPRGDDPGAWAWDRENAAEGGVQDNAGPRGMMIRRMTCDRIARASERHTVEVNAGGPS